MKNTMKHYGVWHKGEFRDNPGTFYACRWDAQKKLYTLLPFAPGSAGFNLDEKSFVECVRLLGEISRIAARERRIAHTLAKNGGRTSLMYG